MYLFLDLELNGREKDEIIEIGAVAYDHEFKNEYSFRKYVLPNESITEHVEVLTGIKNDHIFELSKGKSFETVLKEFVDFVDKIKTKINEDLLCIAWGDDFKKIRKDAQLTKYAEDYNRVFKRAKYGDYQKIFSKKVVYDGKQLTKRVALDDAKKLTDNVEGVKHDALKDARDTAFIYRKSEMENYQLNVDYLSKMYEEKKEHIQRMETAKENSLKHYFDFLDKQHVFEFYIDAKLYRLLKTGQNFLFENIEEIVNEPEIFSRKKEFSPKCMKIKLSILASYIEGILLLDIVVSKEGKTAGHISIKANHDNKRFLKKFLQLGMRQENPQKMRKGAPSFVA